MAQSKKQDEIIDLTEIVEKGRTPSTAPSANVDFDSALSDLLDKKSGSISLDETPELEELLAGLDDDASAAKQTAASAPGTEDGSTSAEAPEDAAQPDEKQPDETSAFAVPDDLDALIGGLELPDNGRTAGPASVPPSAAPATDTSAEVPVEDVDSLLDSLLPEENIPASAPKVGTQEISEADLDDLLNSIELESAGSAPASEDKPSVPDAKLSVEQADPGALLDPAEPKEGVPSAAAESMPSNVASPQTESGATEDFGNLGTLLDEVSGTEGNPVGEAGDSAEQDGAFDAADLAELDGLFGAGQDSEVSTLPESPEVVPESDMQTPGGTPPEEELPTETTEDLSVPGASSSEEIPVVAELLEAAPGAVSSAVCGAVMAEGVAAAVSGAPAAPQWMERLEAEMTALRERMNVLESALQPESIQERILELLVEGSPLSNRLTELMRAAVAEEVGEAASRAKAAENAASALRERAEAAENAASALRERVEALEGRDFGPEAGDIIRDRLAPVEQQVSEGFNAFQTRLSDLEARLPEPEVLNGLQQRLEVLESRDSGADAAAKLQERLSHVERQVPEALNALQAQLAGIESRLPASGATDPALVSALQERLTALEGREVSDGLEDRLARVEERQQDLSWERQQAVGELQDRLSALEQRGDEALERRLAALEALADARLEERMASLEERPEPDVAALAVDVLKRVRSELDKVAAQSAARVLREEIEALVSGS